MGVGNTEIVIGRGEKHWFMIGFSAEKEFGYGESGHLA